MDKKIFSFHNCFRSDFDNFHGRQKRLLNLLNEQGNENFEETESVYRKYNQRFNKNDVVDISTLSVPNFKIDYGKQFGLSDNIKSALIKVGKSNTEAKNIMFEILDALDESCRSELGLQKGVDELATWLKAKDCLSFSLENGQIVFRNSAHNVIRSFLAISGRQEAIRSSLLANVENQKSEAIKESSRKAAQLARRIAKKTAIAELGAANNSRAVSIDLPKLDPENKPIFVLPREQWISITNPPEVIDKRFRKEIVCMGYVGELIRREVGGARNLGKLGYIDGQTKAWSFKHNLGVKGNIETIDSMQKDYLTLTSSGNISLVPENIKNAEQYKNSVSRMRGALVERLQSSDQTAKSPFVMTLLYRYSNYAKEAASYVDYQPYFDRKTKTYKSKPRKKPLDQEYLSLNTHITYCLGLGKRKLPGEPAGRVSLTSFVETSLKINDQTEYLLKGVKIYVNGVECFYNGEIFIDSNKTEVFVTSSDTIELEDVYFAHYFGDSKVESFTALIASGNYDPVDILRVKSENLKIKVQPREKIAEVPLKDVFYLQKGDTIQGAFERSFPQDKDKWEIVDWYLKEIGFDARHVKLDIDPIPVPDFQKLAEHIGSGGGFAGIKASEIKKKVDKFNESNPGEYISIVMKASDKPWGLLMGHLKLRQICEEIDPPLFAAEKLLILEEIDLLNAGIDLRLFKNPQEHKEYLQYEIGSVFWVSEEIMKALLTNIKLERERKQIYVPEKITRRYQKVDGQIYNEEVIEFTAQERQLIEEMTYDPVMRTLLTMILMNEQKGGSKRKKMAWLGETFTDWEESSIGMFQIAITRDDYLKQIDDLLKLMRPDDKDYKNLILAKQKHDFELFRSIVKENPTVNAALALARLNEIRTNLNVYLEAAGQGNIDQMSQDYLAAVLTLYNRPPYYVYNGCLGKMGQQIADSFGLGLRPYTFYERHIPAEVTKQRAVRIAYEAISRGNDPLQAVMVERIFNLAKLPIEPKQISAGTTENVAAFWTDIVMNMKLKGVMEDISEQESLRDIELIKTGHLANFLKSKTFVSLKNLYEIKSKNDLSLIVSDKSGEFLTTSIENYGFRAINGGVIDKNILPFSEIRRSAAIASQELPAQPINISNLASAKLRRKDDHEITIASLDSNNNPMSQN